MPQSVTHYNRLSKLFHWTSALLVILLFSLGVWMVDLSYYSEWYKTAPHWHKSIGICLFAITLLRIIYKNVTASPKIEGARWEVISAKIAHTLIYILLFTIFISGYLISTADGRAIEIFNWFSIPGFGSFIENQEDIAGDIHYYLAYTLIALASVHALAALKHHFIDKDNTLKKML
ncbi:cytochrome b [Psychromonas sp. MME2]|uniref:cytochrome b n=1 Tax=unclassified Psychromonas TaxID=2614957 RepID=UPI00339C8D5E